ncbi:MAG: hypothetical protein P1U89_26775 [Verrucomicrobiales bacterium]|nr:hypothetical protein [Verrucomicrobiales bacterium]
MHSNGFKLSLQDGLKVEVSEETAARLQAKVSEENTDPGTPASRLFTDALSQDEGDGSTINQRRVELIRISGQRPMTEEDKTELETLQDAANLQAEAQDRAMSVHLAQQELAIDKLP